MRVTKITTMLLLACMTAMPAWADSSRILGTGGASTIEGAAGGGIVPWAALVGYGSEGEWGAAAFSTQLRVTDYSLDAKGLAISYNNRVEVSYARQNFDLGTLGDALGLSGHRFRQNVFGLKYRVSGDLIYGTLPQFSVGLQHKNHLDFAVPALVGGLRDSDDELYVSAAKVWLAGVLDRNVFLNITARYSRANQAGLLGFGGDLGDKRDVLLEGSGGFFLNRKLALGMEYRQHPENLGFSPQDAWKDVFVAWFPTKHLSVVAAHADLGTVATLPDQRGWYVSFAVSY
ncbi:MAG: DUF3034 family protein [Pseudomonadota bacterium]